MAEACGAPQILRKIFGAHSSMVEQVPFKHVVGGSNPPGLTRRSTTYTFRPSILLGTTLFSVGSSVQNFFEILVS